MKNIFKKIYLTLFCLFPFVTTACYKMNSRIYDESHYTCFLGEKVVDIYGNYIIINNVSYLSNDKYDNGKVDHYFALNLETNLLIEDLISYEGTLCRVKTDWIRPSFYSDNKLYFSLTDELHEFICGGKEEIGEIVFPEPGSRSDNQEEAYNVYFLLGPLNFGATYDDSGKTGYMRDVQLRMRILK